MMRARGIGLADNRRTAPIPASPDLPAAKTLDTKRALRRPRTLDRRGRLWSEAEPSATLVPLAGRHCSADPHCRTRPFAAREHNDFTSKEKRTLARTPEQGARVQLLPSGN